MYVTFNEQKSWKKAKKIKLLLSAFSFNAYSFWLSASGFIS